MNKNSGTIRATTTDGVVYVAAGDVAELLAATVRRYAQDTGRLAVAIRQIVSTLHDAADMGGSEDGAS